MIAPATAFKANSTKEVINIVAKSSLFIKLSIKVTNDNGNTTNSSFKCVATVELQSQPTDAKISYTQPWLD